MQSNFLFDKLQGGTSLFMRSHPASLTGVHEGGVPLGIKTVAQGIQNFTDWQSLSDRLEERKFASFEDVQPNKLSFGQHDVLPQVMSRTIGSRNYWFPRPGNRIDVNFEDSWRANRVKVYDDMAFVAYEDYTDLHRVDIELTDAELRQYLFTQFLHVDYDMIVTDTDISGTLSLETEQLTSYDRVSVTNTSRDRNYLSSQNVSIDFASYQNSILKVELAGTVNRGAKNVASESGQNMPQVIYFTYGGTLKNDTESANTPLNRLDLQYDEADRTRGILTNGKLNPSIDFDVENTTFSDLGQTPASLTNRLLGDEKAVVGKFYLVVDEHDTTQYSQAQSNLYKVDKNTHRIGIQLTIQSNYGKTQGSPNNLRDVFPYTKYGPTAQGEGLYFQTVDTDKITLIKIQPVRKCGKVDIYTKKRGIVFSAVNNTITSNGHKLNTNDVINISSALLSDSHAGLADTHPMNGLKYVKVLDDDTFEIYEDEYFEQPTSTANLRSTDGIVWVCTTNNFGSIGQSWDYYGTLFSPTGRNGYKFVDPETEPVTDQLASNDEFFTTKRLISFDDPAYLDANQASITLKFNSSYSSLVNSDFANRIDERIPQTFTGTYDTPLNDPKRAFWDFYPYNCQDDSSSAENNLDQSWSSSNPKKSSYWGCRFGCDLDVKFSHRSGDSRIYTLAVGERGSDFSVDVFGVDERETPYRFAGASDPGDGSLVGTFRRKIIPWHLPHGKTHLLKITVDKYNRISDISHVNTLFGGGTAIVDSGLYTNYQEHNPWKSLQEDIFRVHYKNLCLDPLKDSIISPLLFSNSSLSTNERTYTYLTEISDKTKYWVRAAVTHWQGQSIYDYRRSSSDERKWLREIVAGRKTTTINSDGVNNRSRFGSAGFGGPFTPFTRVDRFDNFGTDNSRGSVYRFIYPWVDSFGKSVALNNYQGLTVITGETDADDITTVVLSASSAKSNIESSINPGSEPVFATSSSLEEVDTVSELGQIQANFVCDVAAGYVNYDHMHINAGGAECSRLFTNMTRKSNGYRKLKTGDSAGFGMPEVLSSCHLSGLCLEWVGDEIVWSDQNLYSASSNVHIFSFDDGFSKQDKFGKNFIDNRVVASFSVPSAENTGDGFGIDFKYEKDIFVTNARSETNELEFTIADHVSGMDRIDLVHVFEKRRGTFGQTQKISASFDRMDETKYPLRLKNTHDLLEIPGAVNYSNNTINSLTWNIDFKGRYDIVNDKILIKDPLEYSVFGRNYNVSDSVSMNETCEHDAEMYLGITEKVKVSDARSNNTLEYEYIPRTTTEYECRDIGGTHADVISTKTPFFFYKLPINNLDVIENLMVHFDIIDEDIFSRFALTGGTDAVDEPNNIVPRVVLYGRDPRTMIIENGPATNGTDNTFPKYENGIWKQVSTIVSGNEYFSYDFPGWYRGGAQDLFFYGRIPGGIINTDTVTIPGQTPRPYLYGGEKNLGEYYDLTAGNRLAGAAGDPAWVAPDVYRSLTTAEKQSVLPYAKLFLATASSDGYTVTIPRDTLKDFVIRGELIKDTDRTTSVVSGFNDTANKYSDIDNIDYSIIIGFVLTNIETFDLNTATITYEEPSSQFNIGALRYILEDTSNNEYVNARYPYSNQVNFYNPSFEGNKYSGTQMDYELRSTIRAVDVVLTKKESSQKRYTNRFSKIAVFEYDQEPRWDVTEKYRTKRTVSEQEANILKAFGYDNFVPVPVIEDKNPVISISANSTAFDLETDNEIINIENVAFDDTSYHLDSKTGNLEYNVSPTGVVVGGANFDQYNLLGGIDLNDDQYLSLTIKNNAIEDGGITLFVEASVASTGNIDLFAKGGTYLNSGVPLWTGTRTEDNNLPLVLKHDVYEQPMSLFIEEIQPSGNITLFTDAPDYDTSIELVLGHTPTGKMPLNIAGPLNYNSGIPLMMTAWDSGNVPLFVKGIGRANSGIPLFMSGITHENLGIPLTFSPGVSGITPLFLESNPPDSGDMPLVMVDPTAPHNSGMTLWIARNNIESNIDLFVKPQRYSNDNADLFIDSPTPHNSGVNLFVDSQIEASGDTTLYTRSIFPSGEMELFVSPIEYYNSGTTLSIGIPVDDEHLTLLMERATNPAIPLYIGGEAVPFPVIDRNGTANLFINSSYGSGVLDLALPVIDYTSGNITLNTTGEAEANYVASTPLFIGKEILANDNISLFTSNDKFAPTAGTTGWYGVDTLSVSGSLSASYGSGSTLYIEVPPSALTPGPIPLFLKVEEPVYGPGGGILQSGVPQLFMQGNNDAGLYYAWNTNTSLLIRNRETDSGNIPLFINRPYGGLAPLFVQSFVDSGNISVYMTGAFIGSGSAPLYITPPEASGVDMFTRGYLE